MTAPVSTARLPGLDLLRAAAILLVLMSHYMGFVSGQPTFGVVGKVGWAGVDLFFVLSGYLIGNQILAPVARGEALALKPFFMRRLLRTLPNYYVVLAVSLLFPGPPIGGAGMAAPWRFLTFTQNFGLAYGTTFTHSWSLCIEEQFYLLLPLAVLALARIGFPVRLAWGLLGGAIAAGMATRAAAFALHGHDAFMAEVYYSSFCRADELLPGVAIALLRNFHPGAFARLQRHANALCALGLAVSVGVLTCIHLDWPATLVTSTFGFSLLAMGFGLLACAALAPHCMLNRVRVPGATRLALWSYAVYLVHKPVFMALRPQLDRLHVDTNAPATVLAVMAAGIAGGWVLYRCVETPFMRLRARWTATHTLVPKLSGNATTGLSNDVTVGQPSPPPAQCFTDSNYNHVAAKRAELCSNGFACAKGSGDNLGLYNVFVTSSVVETSPGFYRKGICQSTRSRAPSSSKTASEKRISSHAGRSPGSPMHPR